MDEEIKFHFTKKKIENGGHEFQTSNFKFL